MHDATASLVPSAPARRLGGVPSAMGSPRRFGTRIRRALPIEGSLVRKRAPVRGVNRCARRCGLLLLVLPAATAHAADQLRTVPSGKDRRIDFFASVNPDCSSMGIPTVRLIEGPSDGVITTDRARDFLPFPRTNIRAKCNGRRVAGLRLLYQSTTEYFGSDKVRLLVISASGGEREATYVISVK